MQIFGQINIAVFDWPWSGVHFVSGLVIGVGLIVVFRAIKPKTFWVAGCMLLLLWELVEVALRYFDIHAHEAIAPLKQLVGGFAFAPETNANIIGDLVIGVVGLWVGRVLGAGLHRRM